MHNHNRFTRFFSEDGGAARQRPSGHGCQGRQFGHRPGGPGGLHFGDGPRPGDDGRGPRGFRGGPRGPRAKVGNLRLAVLALLAEEPRNGYSMIQEVSQRSGGLWQPSPGSMYPALSALEDEGLIEVHPQDGKKAYALTETGRQYVHDNQEALSAVWEPEQEGGRGGRIEVRSALHALMGAVQQVAQAGSEAQVKEAASILNTARKSLYRLLAEDAG